MKKLFLKSLALVMMLTMSVSMWAVDWSSIEWAGNASGNAAYTDAYKLSVPAGCGFVNIQSSFGTEPGFYVTVPAADITCSLEASQYATQGAGMLLYISAFTQEETEVTVTCNGGQNYVFVVYKKQAPAPDPEQTEIDWSTISWVAASGDKFKVGAANAANMPQEVVSVQQPGFATKPGIYMTFPGGVSDCSHNCGIQGGGICLYIDQFVAKETEVTVNYAGGSKTFVVYYVDGLDDPDAEIPSEYCRAQFSSGNTACRISWETLDNGNVEISVFEPDGSVEAGKTHFRGNGVNIERLTVGGETAATYFNSNVTAASNVQTLTLKDPAVKPARGAKFAYPNSTVEYAVVKDGNAWPSLAFNYTYGGICDALDAPANVAVADNGTITFDAVTGAETYEVHVFDGANEVYVGTVTNGGVIDYQVYVAKTLTVKVVAKSSAKADSEFSDAATWNAAASPLPVSNWCERAGVVTAANECCHAAFSINTLADGSVAIVIGATEGTPEGAKFRGAKGMNGTFTLNGSAADFTACFTPSLSADKKTVTLALNGEAPALGSIIDYSGQIECASSLHANDWSNYDIKGYIYGTKCPTDAPVTGVALSQTTATIYVGDAALSLSPVFTPSNAGNKNVTWATSADAVATVANGQVTAVAPGEATITVTTEDGGFQATCVVTVKAAVEAPAAPTWDAAVVKAVYSATYGADCGFGEWGSGTQYTQKAAGKYYTGGNYFGLLFEGADAKNCAAMDHLHLDVYPLENVNLEIFPIWGGAEQGIRTGELTAGQWNSVDMELSAWTGITNWTNIYQIKVAAVEGKTIYLNNVYFYRESADVDTEAPVMTSASLVSTSFLNAVLAVEATDNVAVTQYLVKNADVELGKFAPADGKITVTGLAMGTEYTLSVYAMDAAENVSENKIDVNFTTVAGPAPVAAPTYDAGDVIAIYSDAYTPAATHTQGGWGQSTHEENMEIAVGEHALLMTNCNYQGWELSTDLNISAMTHVHMDVYVAEATQIGYGFVLRGNDPAPIVRQLVAGWNTVEIPIASYTGDKSGAVFQMKWNNMPATCWIDNVFFVHKIVAVESIELNKTELALVPGATETLVATVLPADATNKNFTWATDAAGVATVENGVVTAVAEGTANITATTEDGEKVATCVVTVAVVHPASVELNKTELTLAPEATETLVATVLPADAANKNVTWATDNAEVATVADGVVTAIAEGTANITVTTEDGSKTATCVVTVENPDVPGPDEVMLQSGAHKIFYTAYKYACGVYELSIRSSETLNGFGGSFFNPGNVDVRSVAQKVGDKLVVTIKDAASDPQFYTPLYVLMPGEVNFGSVTIDWIAKNPVATASSGSGIQAPLTPGHGGRWESAATDNEWWMVNYNHKHEFNTVAIDWEGAYSKQFTLEGSNDGENFTVLYTEENQTSAGEHIYTLDATVEYQYVKINITKRGTDWANSFYEFKTYTAQASVLTTLTMTAAKPYTAIGQGVALTVVGKDQYNVPMAEFGEVEYTVTPAAAGEVVAGQFVPAQAGKATIAAHVGEVYANEVEVYVITENVNLALSTNIESDNKIVAQSDKGEKGTDAFLAVDGNDGSIWQGSPWDGDSPETGHVYDSWFVVDLGAKYDLELITIHFEGACSRHYHVDASLDNATWTTLDNGGSGQQNYTALHAISETAARYVRFWSTEAATGWGMKMYEFQVFGVEAPVEPIPVTGIALNKTTTSLEVGENETLTVIYTPENTTQKGITWTTDAAGVATVENGVVTAVAEGTATITATSTENNEVYATCVVTVTADPYAGDWVVLEKGANRIQYLAIHYIGTNVYSLTVEGLTANVTGMGGAYWNVNGVGARIDASKEQISDAAIRMQVESTPAPQMYTPFYVLMPGEVNFGQFTINWLDKEAPVTPVSGVTLSESTRELVIGEDFTLTAAIQPAYATDKNVTWESNNTDVATVVDGVVTAVAAGEATITVTTHDGGYTATCAVTVIAALTPKTTYGTHVFKFTDGEWAAFNYSITRNADRTVTLTATFNRDVTGKIGADNFQLFYKGTYPRMAYVADTKTATYTFEGKHIDDDVLNFAFRFVIEGGLIEKQISYTVGSESEPKADLIAAIGSTAYATLADAFAAVPTDGTETTITMLDNVDLAAALTIANTKNIVLNLNGQTIKNEASKSLGQLITVNGKLTIDDKATTGKIQNTASGKYVIKTGTAASVLTLKNGTIETTTGNSNGAVYGTNGSFVMTGGKIIAAGTGVTSKNVNISGGEITATAGQALCAAGTISGGTFTSTNSFAVYANQSGTLEITGGEFTGVDTKPTINIYSADVKVTGATLNNGVGFASNATAMLLAGTDDDCLAATHAAFYDGETLVGYAPINTGLLASSKVSGKTVKLTKNVATTTFLNVTKSFTLDLNSHDITCTPAKADAAILAKGSQSAPVVLTIKGEGAISCGDHGEGCNAIQVSNYATVNIEGGEFSVPGDNSTIYMLATAGNSAVNISGGEFKSGDGKYVLNIKDDVRAYNTFVVTGGKFYGFNPSDNTAEGAHTNFCAEDYTGVETSANVFEVLLVEPIRNGLTVGKMGTICYGYDLAEVKGATFYKPIAYDGFYLHFEEVDEVLAGYGYMFVAEAEKITAVKLGDVELTNAITGAPNHMQGILENDSKDLPEGRDYCGIKNGHWQFFGENNTMTAGHAYIVLPGLPTEPQSQSQNRRRLVVSSADNTAVVTGLDFSDLDTEVATKVLRDGQLYIIREGKMYNVQGAVVK